jgi:hypothetical protein
MDKAITLDILTGLSAREAGRKYGVTHQAACRIVDRVVKQVTVNRALPDHKQTIAGYKSISNRLVPIVFNHYKEV